MTDGTMRISRVTVSGMSALRDMVISAGQRANLNFSLCAASVAACLMLGGGTRGGFLSDAILQLLSIPLFLVSLSGLTQLPLRKQTRDTKSALCLCAAIVLLPIVQLISLPYWLWSALPARRQIAAEFDLVGVGSTWMPLTVTPNATWLSLLSLLPPVAVFLGTIQLRYEERRTLSLVILAIGLISVFLGFMQLAQGPASPLRFFEYTNTTEAVGFFANRNHFSALLYALTLFATAWAIDIAFNSGSWERRNWQSSSVALLTASFTVLVVLIAAQTMARSRAGLILTIVALAGGFALTVPGQRNGTDGITPRRLLFSAITLAVVFAVQFALYRILERFDIDPMDDARIPFARNTLEAAKTYMPFGSGIGSFVPVYAMFEKPPDILPNLYANHAHNDVLELWLETGLAGIVLFGAFAVWFVLRTIKLWRRVGEKGCELDNSLARAATIVIVLLMAHSFVDYPLRTDALMSMFAFSCALLVEPLAGLKGAIPARIHAARTQAAQRTKPREPALAATTASRVTKSAEPPPATSLPQRPQGRWGEDVVWPEEWSRSMKPNPARAEDKVPNIGPGSDDADH